MEKIFTDIYNVKKTNQGSIIATNTLLIAVIKQYCIDNNVKTICDIGCGSAEWIMPLINSLDIKYIGIDVVKPIINTLQNKYSSHQFIHADVTTDIIPEADLYIIKDVLQHWVLDETITFLKMMVSRKSRLLIMNNNQIERNSVIARTGGLRSMRQKCYPLILFRCTKLVTWENNDCYEVTEKS